MRTSVLIIGSGPTGLVMASRLKSLGVSVRIIDGLEQPKTTSRAFTVHARTLELLGQMGLADKFLTRGLKTLSMDYHFPTQKETPQLDFTQLDSVFPFCLSINQAETEAVLREYAASLGIEIEWNTRLDSLITQDSDPSTVTVQHLDTNRSEVITTDWLIGCDGHFSTVRQQLNISLDGDEYAGTMRMIDTRMTGFEYSDTAVHYFIAKDQMLLVHKLPGANHRLLISDRTEGVPLEQARAAFQSVLDHQFAGNVQIDEPVWATNFRLSKRQVSSYCQGSVFLAGDAAHINSPAGGQGMNVAMQDAFNLSWKLAMVIKGEAHPTLLDSYEIERAPVASQMLEGTNYIHSIIMAHGQGMQERIERMRGGKWNKQAVNQVAGISYTYRVLTTTTESESPDRSLAIGDRAPDAVLAGQHRVYDLISSDGYTIFLFLGNAGNVEQFHQLTALGEQTNQGFKATLSIWIIVPTTFAPQLSPTTPPIQTLVDNHDIYPLYEVADDSQVYLLRPDCHIAYFGATEDRNTFLAALAEVLTPNPCPV